MLLQALRNSKLEVTQLEDARVVTILKMLYIIITLVWLDTKLFANSACYNMLIKYLLTPLVYVLCSLGNKNVIILSTSLLQNKC
jgi:hypothetical protein